MQSLWCVLNPGYNIPTEGLASLLLVDGSDYLVVHAYVALGVMNIKVVECEMNIKLHIYPCTMPYPGQNEFFSFLKPHPSGAGQHTELTCHNGGTRPAPSSTTTHAQPMKRPSHDTIPLAQTNDMTQLYKS